MMDVNSNRNLNFHYSLPLNSITLYAESIGIDAKNDEINRILSEDSAYRLQHVINIAFTFMKSSKRTRMIGNDIQNALETLNFHKPLECSNIQNGDYLSVEDEKVFSIPSSFVSLDERVKDNAPIITTETPSVSGLWLAIDGYDDFLFPFPNLKIDSSLVKFYEDAVDLILSDGEIQNQKLALIELQKNTKISYVLPYFINFISSGIHRVSHDVTQLSAFLYTASSLINNKSVFLDLIPYSTLLKESLWKCVTGPLSTSMNPLRDHWTIRDFSAGVLANFVMTWTSEQNNMLNEILAKGLEVLTTKDYPLYSMYGVVRLFHMFGYTVVKNYIDEILMAFHFVTSLTKENLRFNDAVHWSSNFENSIALIHFQYAVSSCLGFFTRCFIDSFHTNLKAKLFYDLSDNALCGGDATSATFSFGIDYITELLFQLKNTRERSSTSHIPKMAKRDQKEMPSQPKCENLEFHLYQAATSNDKKSTKQLTDEILSKSLDSEMKPYIIPKELSLFMSDRSSSRDGTTNEQSLSPKFLKSPIDDQSPKQLAVNIADDPGGGHIKLRFTKRPRKKSTSSTAIMTTTPAKSSAKHSTSDKKKKIIVQSVQTMFESLSTKIIPNRYTFNFHIPRAKSLGHFTKTITKDRRLFSLPNNAIISLNDELGKEKCTLETTVTKHQKIEKSLTNLSSDNTVNKNSTASSVDQLMKTMKLLNRMYRRRNSSCSLLKSDSLRYFSLAYWECLEMTL